MADGDKGDENTVLPLSTVYESSPTFSLFYFPEREAGRGEFTIGFQIHVNDFILKI